MKLIEYPDREALVLSLAQEIVGRLRQSLSSEGRATLCLPGGSTPEPLLSQLADMALEWERVVVFPGDERCVPPDDARSNAGLLRRHLMAGPAAAAQFIDLFTGTGTLEEEAAAAAERLKPALPITVLLLGMGEDMHVASLFPGNDGTLAALEPGAPPVAVIHPDGGAEPRLTLTAPVLKKAMDPHLMIFGQSKREALERAAKLTPAEAPVRVVWGDLCVHWAE
ncbi:6-phosphogluconolactonase [Paracoccus sp. Z118]|uniref:6-phosphogluconolactonase n=1 Tax=Paracoccus sp. Z118 TaxID=2851017 RepID=UPI001C2CA2DC|nr:6-phosphogluconolactonase [Paracoccus sp. Z118]MBV0892515.1 6-phosphogluconolactonase [Paracoccus sp. Z118]